LQSSWGQAHDSLHDYGFFPFHVHNVQAVQPFDYIVRENFFNWLLRDQEPWKEILFTDETTCSAEMASQTQEVHMCGSTEILVRPNETHFHNRFSLSISCGVLSEAC
jgi:hypothetical protein